MKIKIIFRTALAAFVLAACAAAADAQVVTVNGKVTLKQADGTAAPVQGAVVEFYRTDVKGRPRSRPTRTASTRTPASRSRIVTVVVSPARARPTTSSASASRSSRTTTSRSTRRRLPPDPERRERHQGAPRAAGRRRAARPEPRRSRPSCAERARVEQENQKIAGSNEIVARTFKPAHEALKRQPLRRGHRRLHEGPGLRARRWPSSQPLGGAAPPRRGALQRGHQDDGRGPQDRARLRRPSRTARRGRVQPRGPSPCRHADAPPTPRVRPPAQNSWPRSATRAEAGLSRLR